MNSLSSEISLNITHRPSFRMAIALYGFIIVIGFASAAIMLLEVRFTFVLVLFMLAAMVSIFVLLRLKFIRANPRFIIIGEEVVKWNDINKIVLLDIVGATCIVKYFRGYERITAVTIVKLFEPYESLIEDILSMWNNAIHDNVVVSHNMFGTELISPPSGKGDMQ